MPDNIFITELAEYIAADDVSGVKHQRIEIETLDPDGQPVVVSADAPLPAADQAVLAWLSGSAVGANTAGTVDATRDQMAAANVGRVAITAFNLSATTTLYVGDATVTAANGIPIPPGAAYEERDFKGALYGVTEAGSVAYRVWEVG